MTPYAPGFCASNQTAGNALHCAEPNRMSHVEHLVLTASYHLRGLRFKTKFHDDLGSDLQKALEVLEKEGWEAVALSHDASGVPTVVLKMIPR